MNSENSQERKQISPDRRSTLKAIGTIGIGSFAFSTNVLGSSSEKDITINNVDPVADFETDSIDDILGRHTYYIGAGINHLETIEFGGSVQHVFYSVTHGAAVDNGNPTDGIAATATEIVELEGGSTQVNEGFTSAQYGVNGDENDSNGEDVSYDREIADLIIDWGGELRDATPGLGTILTTIDALDAYMDSQTTNVTRAEWAPKGVQSVSHIAAFNFTHDSGSSESFRVDAAVDPARIRNTIQADDTGLSTQSNQKIKMKDLPKNYQQLFDFKPEDRVTIRDDFTFESKTKIDHKSKEERS